MIRNIYSHQHANKILQIPILQIPISKTGSVQDQVTWKHANDGVYQVKLAYDLLMKECEGTYQNAQDQRGAWNLIWKVQVPFKINIFAWKLLKDSLPTMLALKNRSILLTVLALCAIQRKNLQPTCFYYVLLLEPIGMV